MRAAKKAVFWKVYGHSWMSWEAPSCTSWRRRSMAQQRGESGDRRSRKPVTALMCIASLLLWTLPNHPSYFWLTARMFITTFTLKNSPSDSKCEVCALPCYWSLTWTLLVDSQKGEKQSHILICKKELVRCSHCGEREKKKKGTRLPQGWTTDLQKQSLMCCPLGHASNETRCKSLAYNAWASTSIYLCVCVAFVVFHKFGGSDNVRSSQNDLADEPRHANTTRN